MDRSEHDERLYMGCLRFDDDGFCRHIFDLLQNYRGCSIKEIGGLGVSDLLPRQR